MSPTRRTVTTGLLAGLAGLAGVGSVAGQESDGTTITYDGDGPTLDAAPGQVVSGQSQFAEGIELTVRLRSSGPTPFLFTTEAPVDADGGFAAEFDLSDVEPGTTFTASVHWYGVEQTSVEGTVSGVNPRVSFDYEGQVLTLAPEATQSVTGEAALSDGADLTLRLRSNRSSPFLRSAEATVEDGAFEAAFDLSDVEAGTFGLLEAYYDGSRRTYAIVEIAE